MIFVVALVLVVIIIFIGIYNGLVRKRQDVRASWAQIDVQLKKRYDLVPNLVETVKGYAAHERETLENVTKARQMAVDASNVQEQQKAENFLTSTLRSLFAVSEAYPDLKANQNFLMLQEELAGIESKIAYARQHYNDVVMVYETTRMQFPASIVAGMAGFGLEEYFEIEIPEEKEVPKVQF
ncbi:LemA family protein [bacterium]|nr:LemA family protein [bacterium]